MAIHSTILHNLALLMEIGSINRSPDSNLTNIKLQQTNKLTYNLQFAKQEHADTRQELTITFTGRYSIDDNTLKVSTHST